MTKALAAVLDRLNSLPDDRQDEIAELLERAVTQNASAKLAESDWAEIDRRLAGRAHFASDDEVEAFFRSAAV